MTRYCVECGSPLPENSGKSRLRCSECQHDRKLMLERERRTKKKFDKKANATLAEIVREANKKHMSYGQYVASFEKRTKMR